MSETMEGADLEVDANLAPDGDSAHQVNETEQQARRMGWVPKEEFRGDPDRWRPADEFVDRGTSMLPILQEQYRRLDGRYAGVQRELEESRQALADLTDRARRADERAYKRALRDIEAKREAAVANADMGAFHEAERELRDLQDGQGEPDRGQQREKRAHQAAPSQPQSAPHREEMAPEVSAFIRENPWFTANVEAQGDAIAIQSAVDRQHPNLTLSERLEITRKKVRQLHPDLFSNARRTAPPSVTPSSGETRRAPNPRSFEALPADVRKEYDRYSRALAGKGKPLTKEEWAGYYWENEA